MLSIHNDCFNIENNVVYQVVADGHGNCENIFLKLL